MKSRRGLSAVVGSVFLIAIVMGTLSYVSYTLDVMGNFSESMAVEEIRQEEKRQESYEVETIDIITGDKLGGTIKNSGDIPVEIATLYIDEQGVDDVVRKYTLDTAIAPGGTIDIQNLVDIDIDPTKGYNMKVISSRGEVDTFYVNSVSDQNVYMTLTASPTIIPSTFTTTLHYTVVNNMTNGNYLYNITPSMNDTGQILVDASAGLTTTYISGPEPASYDALGPGEVAVFTYVYQLVSDSAGDQAWFNATLSNANKGNEVLTGVTVQEVPLATESGSSLTSLSLTDTAGDLPDVLYFHLDNTLSPNSEYQMDGSSPNTGGITRGLNEGDGTLTFITAEMIEDVTVPVGDFDLRLNYYSNIVPLGFPEPSFAFMMDCFDCGDEWEISSAINRFDENKGFKTTDRSDENPDFSANGGAETPGGGPDGDEYYHFDNGEYFRDDWSVDGGSEKAYTEIQSYDTTTALWLRIEPTGNTYKGVVTWGCAPGDDCDDEDTYYIAVVTGGEIEFGYDDDVQPSSIDVVCKTDDEYDDDTWYHVVVTREGGKCEIWIDGGQTEYVTSGTVGGSGSGDIKVQRIDIGRDSDEEDWDGDIASFIHWNQNKLSSEQIEDLYYTNYGNNATWFDLRIERVNAAGDTVIGTPLVDETKVNVPFKDPSIGNYDDQGGDWISIDTSNSTLQKFMGDADEDDNEPIYGVVTVNMGTETTVLATERLRLTLDWNGYDEQNLPININWDRTGWSYPLGSSHLETPQPDPAWPTFLSFDHEEELTFKAFNDGPEGIWFVFSGTRLVLTTNDGLNSYAAVPQYVNYTTAINPASTHAVISPTQDSMYIPDQHYAFIDFYPIQAPPAQDDSPCSECQVPSGQYNAALYLEGYDESGETFKKTINLGLVDITGNP